MSTFCSHGMEGTFVSDDQYGMTFQLDFFHPVSDQSPLKWSQTRDAELCVTQAYEEVIH